jgi:MFS family permease
MIGTRTPVPASAAGRNFRRFWIAHSVSVIGTWMQLTAVGWLMLRLTGSGLEVGVVTGVQQLPALLLGPYAGVLVERVDKRRLLLALQAVLVGQAVALGVLTTCGAVRPWHLVALSALLGCCSAVEVPTRQVLVGEIVGDRRLPNAAGLMAVTVNAAGLAGILAGGTLIALGEGTCFLINAASFLGLLVVLRTLDSHDLTPNPVVVRARGQLREALRCAVRTPAIGAILAMTAVVCLLAWQLAVSLSAFAYQVLHAGPDGYSALYAAVGVGAGAGAVVLARRCPTGLRSVSLAAAIAAPLMLVAALAPTFISAVVALAVLGLATVVFFVAGQTTVQLAAPAEMRSRMVSLYGAVTAMAAVGAPIVGWLIGEMGARAGLLIGAGAFGIAAVTGVMGLLTSRRSVREVRA